MEGTTFRVTNDMLASQGQRFGNYLIDLGIQYVLIFILALLLGIFANLTGNFELGIWLENISTVESYLIGVVILIIYYSLMEIYFSRSIAKYITKTIVVTRDGSKPDASTIIKRTFCRLIPFNHFSFLGNDGRGWHDSISETYVVKKDFFDQKKDLFYSFDEIGKEQE